MNEEVMETTVFFITTSKFYVGFQNWKPGALTNVYGEAAPLVSQR